MIPTFSEKISNYHWVELIIFTFSILAGINVLLARKYLFRLIVFLGAFVLIVRVLNTDVVPEWLEYVKDFILITYYLIIIYEIFNELIDFSKVDLNTIGAVLAGFFVIGIIGGVIFISIENNSPGSFKGLEEGAKSLNRLVYFSFVTLTTIGYGDISPVSQFAQRVTVLFGLVGNFYSTIVIGIIISKFLSNKNN